jgi:hypothetical protein
MRFIYERARTVNIWLSEHGEGSETVMSLLAGNEINGFRERLMGEL